MNFFAFPPKGIIAISLFFICVNWSTATAAQVSFLPWNEKIAERKLTLFAGKQETPLNELHPLKRSPLVSLPKSDAEAAKVFIRVDDRQDDEGNALRLALQLPANTSQRSLVVIFPKENAPSGLELKIFNDSLRDFPWGSFKLLNGTNEELVLNCGGANKLLPPGLKPIAFRLPNDAASGITIVHRKHPEKPLYTSVWRHEDDSRRLIIMLPSDDLRTGYLAFKAVPEFNVPVAEDENTPPPPPINPP